MGVDCDSEVWDLLQLPIVHIGKFAFNTALYDDPRNLNHSSSHVFVIDDDPTICRYRIPTVDGKKALSQPG